jgi:hypothetical protein
MKKVIFLVIAVIAFMSVLSVNANAQSLYVDANVGDMSPIEESKYHASAVTTVRNSEGELISVVRTDASRYLNDPIIDTFLNSNTDFLIKEGKINGESVKMYKIELGYFNPQCAIETYQVPGFADPCNWYHRSFVTMFQISDGKEEWKIFRGLNHMFTIKGLDYVDSFWTVLSKD